MINLLQQCNFCNNHYGTSECSYRKSFLLQFDIVILQLFYRIKAPIFETLRLVNSAIGPSSDLIQDLVMVTDIIHSYYRRFRALFIVLHSKHKTNIKYLTNVRKYKLKIDVVSRPTWSFSLNYATKIWMNLSPYIYFRISFAHIFSLVSLYPFTFWTTLITNWNHS